MSLAHTDPPTSFVIAGVHSGVKGTQTFGTPTYARPHKPIATLTRIPEGTLPLIVRMNFGFRLNPSNPMGRWIVGRKGASKVMDLSMVLPKLVRPTLFHCPPQISLTSSSICGS